MEVSIIILNYQGKKTISSTLDSILSLNFPKNKFEVIVSDNHSTDNSLSIIKKYISKFKNSKIKLSIKEYSSNYGFAKGNNIAIKTSNSKYVALLNNDCVVDKNWLSELYNAAQSDEQIFSVGSKIKRYPIELNQIQNCGSIIFADGYTKDIGAIISTNHNQSYETDYGQFDHQTDIYSTCGAALLYRQSILEKIGFLDESFFMYYEDLEIAERARLAGYKIISCPQSVVYHNHAQSSIEWSPFFIFHSEKGRLLHVFYHFPSRAFLIEFTKFIIKSKLRLLKSLFTQKNINKSWQYIKVIFYFVFNFYPIIRRRQSYTKLYLPGKRYQNFYQILSGYWYFK